MISGACTLNSRGGLKAAGKTGLEFSGEKQGFFEDRETKSRAAYSGEIYNYPELRLELEKAGCGFSSALESELVLRAYQRWGPACQAKFNGEWSFAVWDAEKKSLFCSRDRFGLRPFYYFFDGKTFAFASKLKALAAFPFVKKEPNKRAVFDYLVSNRPNLPEETFFKDIKQLGPGCCLSVSPAGLVKNKYYNPSYNPDLGEFDKKDLKKHSSEFLGLLKSSLEARLRPPYPLGSTLSGGMDSSTIVCLAEGLLGGSGAGRGKLKLFSILWEKEARYIKDVSGRVGFRSCRIKPAEAAGASWEEIRKVALSFERPLSQTTFFGGLALLKKAAGEGVKVILDGGGGDELLAGYPEKYFSVYLGQVIRGGDLARFAREFRVLYADRLGDFGVGKKIGPEFYKTFLRTQTGAPGLSAVFPEKTLNGEFFRDCSRRAGREPAGLQLNLQEMLYRDTLKLGCEYNPRASVTYRRPFLDHRLVEYVFSLPACYKLHGGWTKFLLREAMNGILPKEVCWRKVKVGGTAPISVWKDFLGRNREKMKAVLGGPVFHSAAFLDQEAVLANFDALFDAAVSPETTDISALWRFVNLELWLGENMK